MLHTSSQGQLTAPTALWTACAARTFACVPSGWPFISSHLSPTTLAPCPGHHCLQSDGGIPNLSPGDPTLRYFAQRRQQLKLLNAALLAALSLAARAVDAASTALIGVPAGCLSLLLLVSTAALGTRQVSGGWVGGVDSGKCFALQCILRLWCTLARSRTPVAAAAQSPAAPPPLCRPPKAG